MPLDESFAQTYLASEIEWDSEPALSLVQQETLLGLGKVDGVYTYRSLASAIYLGWRWKRASAVEGHEDTEGQIFEHIQEMLAEWAWAADSGLGGQAIGAVYAGGISVADKQSREQNTDRVASVFSADMHQSVTPLRTETR